MLINQPTNQTPAPLPPPKIHKTGHDFSQERLTAGRLTADLPFFLLYFKSNPLVSSPILQQFTLPQTPFLFFSILVYKTDLLLQSSFLQSYPLTPASISWEPTDHPGQLSRQANYRSSPLLLFLLYSSTVSFLALWQTTYFDLSSLSASIPNELCRSSWNTLLSSLQ